MSFVWCKQISTADTTGYATRSYFFRLKLSFGSISKSKVMFSFEIIGTSSIIKILNQIFWGEKMSENNLAQVKQCQKMCKESVEMSLFKKFSDILHWYFISITI